MSVSITVRDVPEQTRNELAARAALAGRSLQEYLRAKLIEIAGQPDAEAQSQPEDPAKGRETRLREPGFT